MWGKEDEMACHKAVLMAVLCSILSLAVSSRAQVTTGTITGVVQDTSNAVVPNARVTITNTQKGTVFTFQTGADGSYFAPFLIPGIYDVKAEKQGFRTQVHTGIVLQVDQQAKVDFTLSVGQVAETVTVTAAPPLVQSHSASLGQVINQTSVEDLPLNGRNFAQLVWLTTGVTTGQIGENLSGASTFNPRAASDFNALGSQANGNGWLIDGIVNNEETFNTVILQPTIESIQEFKVLTGVYSSEFGRGAGIVSVSTRSGSNEYHGSAMDYLRNTVLNARNYFAAPTQPKPPFIRNQFEATLGGPVVIPKVYDGHNHTFIFLDYAGQRQIQGLSFVNTVPTAEVRNGDFSHYTDTKGNLIPIYDPLSTTVVGGQTVRQQFSGNMIPAGEISAVGLRVASIYPFPNAPGNFDNYLNTASRTVDDNSGTIRVDHSFSQTDSMFVRFMYEDYVLNAPQGQSACCLPSNPSQISQYDLGPYVAGIQLTHLKTSGLAIDETHVFRSNLVNDFRMGYARTDPHTTQSDFGHKPADALGIQNINVTPFSTGLPNINVQEFTGLSGGPGFLPVRPVDTLEQVEDTVSWIKGRHQLKFGARWLHRDYSPFTNSNTRGSINFNDNFTNNPTMNSGGSGLATLLLGYSTGGSRGYLVQPYYLSNNEYAVFLEDDFKVNRKLTLNIGGRYDVMKMPIEKYGHITNIDLSRDILIYPGVNGTSQTANVRTQYGNIQPRIGFAYDPFGSGKTVIRGGFGISYFPLMPSATPFLGQNIPYTVTKNYSPATYPLGTDMSTVPTIDDPFGPPVTVQPFTTADLNAANPTAYGWASDYKTPYMESYTLDVQHSLTPTLLLDVGYAGSRGIHLLEGYNPNEVQPGAGFQASRRLIQALSNDSGLNFYFPGNMSNYNSLQVKVQKYMSKGLQFLASYTWSKSLDYAGTAASGGGAVGNPQTYTNRKAGYGPSGFDHTNRFVGSWVYQLPVGGQGQLLGNNAALSRVVGGWEFDGIGTLESGFPFSLSLNQGVNNGATSWPDRICPGRLSNPDPIKWFDTSCFVAPPPNTYGNVARGVLFGPGLVNFDVSFVKNTKITERLNLQFRADAFNVFNTPSFSVNGINRSIGAATAGKITSTNIDNREFQMALKLTF
jgi:Carboxypeptidase regulatory-like domain/TonB dependent receptor-like, beta-barrel